MKSLFSPLSPKFSVPNLALLLAGLLLTDRLSADASFTWDNDIKGIHEISMYQWYGGAGNSYTNLSYETLADQASAFGTKHEAFNIVADSLLPATLGGGDTPYPYTYNGVIYNFSSNYISNLDATIRDFTNRGIKTTAIILLLHKGPSAFYYSASPCSGPAFWGFNMSTSAGQNIFGAVISFLVGRYSNESDPSVYGLISGYIIGNELQNAVSSYNMGSSLSVSYVAGEYAKAIEIVWNIIQTVNSRVRVYISLDRNWGSPNGDQYSGLNFIGAFDSAVKALPDGNIGWDVAFHPYASSLAPWSDSVSQSFTSSLITIKNIEVLYFYLNQPTFQYSGNVRRVILSEQGVADDGTGSSSSRAQQAAAYAYYYIRASRTPNIDAMQWISHQDANYGGTYGWIYRGLIDRYGTLKPSYTDAYQYADTSLWESNFAPYLSAIGVASWNDINPYVVRPITGASTTTNLSYRGSVGPGATLIGGLVVSGGTETLLIRAVGPALNSFGISNYLADPKITVLQGATVIGSNVRWQTNANPSSISSAASAVGAFSLSPGDSALLLNLGTGSYTLNVDTASGSNTGVSLLEVYDCGTVSGSPTLINFSGRNTVGTGSNVGVGSLVVSGPGTKAYLIRADGPALGAYGISGYLPNPRITIVDAATGAQIVQNAGWSNSLNENDTSTYGSEVGAFPLSSGSADSALFVRLYPGSYSIVVDDVNGHSGIALFEVYDAGQ